MRNQTAIVLEDSPEYSLFLRNVLTVLFNRVFIAETLQEGFNLHFKHRARLFLVDVNLGQENGFDFVQKCFNLDVVERPAILFLTSRNSVVDKLTGFSLGADDYIVKPIDPLELQARVRAILARVDRGAELRTQYSIGGIHLDWSSQKVYLTGGSGQLEILLTYTERKILKELMQRKGQVVTREQLLDLVWGSSIAVSDRNIDSHIYSLRKKLKGYASYVNTVAGLGYCFEA